MHYYGTKLNNTQPLETKKVPIGSCVERDIDGTIAIVTVHRIIRVVPNTYLSINVDYLISTHITYRNGFVFALILGAYTYVCIYIFI